MDKMQREAEDFIKPSVSPDQQADPSVRTGRVPSPPFV